MGYIDPLGLVEGSPSNVAKRNAIAAWALKQNGASSFGYYSNYSPQYPSGSYKCSAFTCAAAAAAGAPTAVKIPGRRGECPTAAELSNGHIPNWRKLRPYEQTAPGDIASIAKGGDGFTGHAAILVMTASRSVSSIGAHGNIVGPVGADNFGYDSVVFSRYTGD